MPLTAIAFRFFDPITAPGPVRAACRPPSFVMLAYRTRFSPARPMHATRLRCPSRPLTARSVSEVLRPINSLPSRKSTAPSSMDSRHGNSLLPVMMSASHPAFFSSVAMKLDDSESPMKPVSGDFVSTANLLEVVSLLPTSGLVTNMSGFPGDRGSTPGGQCSYSRYAPSPVPPMKRRSASASSGCQRLVRRVRSTTSALPLYPYSTSSSPSSKIAATETYALMRLAHIVTCNGTIALSTRLAGIHFRDSRIPLFIPLFVIPAKHVPVPEQGAGIHPVDTLPIFAIPAHIERPPFNHPPDSKTAAKYPRHSKPSRHSPQTLYR